MRQALDWRSVLAAEAQARAAGRAVRVEATRLAGAKVRTSSTCTHTRKRTRTHTRACGVRCDRVATHAAAIAPHSHFTWGAAPFPTKDGRSCFYFTWLTGWDDGNHTKPVPTSDKLSGSLGIACSPTIAGPYTVVEPIAFPYRPDHFDASYNENPVITYSPHEKAYLMAYTTSPSSVSRSTKNWEGNGGLQYIGFAMSKDPMSAEWERLNRTILYPKPDGFEKHIAINAAVLTYP
jgi:hypothetical protein